VDAAPPAVDAAVRPCVSNADCAAHYADDPVCVAGACEPCSATAACDPGHACELATGRCVEGCLADTDCHATPATPHCDAASHACVACESDAQCPMGERCGTDHTCAAGCDPTHACPSGSACVAGACVAAPVRQITLSWDVPGDMDLAVATPAGHTVDYRTPSIDGGSLDHDSMTTGPETITFTHEAPHGHYVVCVFPYSITATTHYTVTASGPGLTTTTYTSFRRTSSGDQPCTSFSPYHVADFDLE
jgi:hypothetical protein